jgi:DNA-directed RNA polymerase I, II, and III subunit RPABC2
MGDEYMDEEEDDDDSDDEQYLQKFDEQLRKNIVNEYHPELIIHSNDDIQAYTRIVKNDKGIIVDPLHTTLPFVTKYERARILGERTKQLNAGAKALVEVEPDVIDGYLIALKEFEEKKIPFIVKRPMPNGGCEYWKLKDLEII